MLRAFVLWLLVVGTISHDQNPCDTEQQHLGLIPSLLRLERTVTLLSTKLEKVTADVTSLKSELRDKDVLLYNFTRSVAKIQTDVAYEVTLPSDISNARHNAPFKFTNVLYNRGAGYRESTGIFTAPVSGTYMFWANIMVHDNAHLNIILYNGNKVIGQGGTPTGIRFGTASLSTTTFLNKGDQIWLAILSGSSKLKGESFSSYGGVLVRAH